MALVYLSLGTNLGEKENNLRSAVSLLSKQIGTVVSQSSFYTFESWGYTSENDFLNTAIAIETDLNPFDVLKKTKKIEKNLGRTSKTKHFYTDRIIDIDILYYDNYIINHPQLIIPHPFIAERKFVLVPLNEIAPDFIHPLLNLPTHKLLKSVDKAIKEN